MGQSVDLATETWPLLGGGGKGVGVELAAAWRPLQAGRLHSLCYAPGQSSPEFASATLESVKVGRG